MIIFSCDCLLDHLIRMTNDEIEKYIMNHVIFSLTDRWLMFICSGNNVLFFCLRAVHIIKPFINERVFCYKRSGFLELIDFSGVNNCCQNCLQILTANLKKNLCKVKK